MTDPVILCESGLSYERQYIEEWIQHNGFVCKEFFQCTSFVFFHFKICK